ncbi:hypothetical protein DH2020_044081 [Rehmannia glutinosa]|uniref:trans-cinnamate 4-monooxygenase n=2 Tax=Rehmannia glutinosa TaxID=99300 RepID=A0ABR0UI55_REHGL
MDLLLLEKTLLGLFFAIVIATLVSKLRGKKFKLPPGPIPVPIFGNWLQVGDDLNHRNLTDFAKNSAIFCSSVWGSAIWSSSPPRPRQGCSPHSGVEFGSRTRNVVFDIFTGKGQDMVFTVYGEHWRKMRRIMTVPFFTNKVVQRNRLGWEAEASAVVEDVKKNSEAATNGIVLRRRLQLMMYNNMYRIMFDRRFESEDDPLFLKLKALNGERSRLAQSFEYNYGDFIPILRPFLRGYLKICKEVKEKRLQLFKDYFVDERKKLASTKATDNDSLKCAIDHILEAQQKGEINEDNVLYIVENINVAAIETTLWSMEWGIAELVNHPEIQKKLRDEMDTILGPGVQITEPDTYKLPYLQALGGYDIPAESKILVNAWWLANNPANWKKPEEFRPERFLEEESKVEANGNDFRYLPFGVGRRSCPGIILALPILGITLGRLVQNFELLPPPGQSKIDTTEKGGQFSLHILKHSTIVLKPRWQVGNGNIIDVWKDPWVPKDSCFYLFGGGITGVNSLKVRDLIDVSSNEWNVELVRRNFDTEDANLILGIPLPRCDRDDQLVWHFTRNGKYSVKTGYHLAKRHYYLKTEESKGGGSSGSHDKPPWLFIWSSNIPEKIKLSVWRLATNSLPLRQNLRRKKIITDTSCPLCDQDEETTIHRAIDCDFARQCWALSNLPHSTWNHRDRDVEIWLRNFHNKLDYNQWRLAMIILWYMWQQRNLKNVGDRFSNPFEVIQLSLVYLQNIDSQCLNYTHQVQQHIDQVWQPPAINSVKINFDASVSPSKNCGGLGIIARDHTGSSLGWKRIRIHGRLHPTTAEAMAAREAVLFAKEKGWRNVMVEGDCLAVITGIRDVDDMYSVESPIYQDIRVILEEFESYELNHVRRNVNSLAHKIATFCVTNCTGTALPF